MDKLLADDYVGITMTGQVVTKSQQFDRMRNPPADADPDALDDEKVKLIGTTAIVTSLAPVEGTTTASVHGTYRYTRVYTRLPNVVMEDYELRSYARWISPPSDPADGIPPRRNEVNPEAPIDYQNGSPWS